MVASRQVESPFYRGNGRQCGRGLGFGALAQDIGRTVSPFLRKYIVPAAKLNVADLLKFVVKEIADIVSDRKIFKTAAKSVERQTLRKQVGSSSNKMSASIVISQNLQNKPVGRQETFLLTLLINHVE